MSSRSKRQGAGKRKAQTENDTTGADIVSIELPIPARSKRRNTMIGMYDDQILYWESQRKSPKEIALLLQQMYTLDPHVFTAKTVSNRLHYLRIKGHRLAPLDIDAKLSGKSSLILRNEKSH